MRCLPPFNEREILRYAGVKGEWDTALLKECLKEAEPHLSYRETHLVLEKEVLFNEVEGARESKGLRLALEGYEKVLLFCATVGIGIDRLMLRYGSISPVKALFFQAIGGERVEAFCDTLCKEWEMEYGKIGSRFSAGYGDFPLTAQRDIFRLLDCQKKIGLTLTESLLMSPTKSVSAIVGITRNTAL